MTLNYDFDIVDVVPGTGRMDPVLDGFLTELGLRPDAGARTVALFRDPRTADALRAAPASLRNFFLASGFGLNTHASGAPMGRYPAKDEEPRLDIIRRLTENAEIHPLPAGEMQAEGADVFRLSDFLADLTRAEPMVERPFLEAVFAAEAEAPAPAPAPVAEVIALPRAPVMPPVFDTTPLPFHTTTALPDAATDQPRKSWRSRFFLMAAAAGLVAAIVHLAGGPGFMQLASL